MTTVLPIQPGGGDEAGVLDAADDSALTVPVFYICGERDAIVPPERCQERFDAAGSSAWMGVLGGASHFVIATSEVGRDNIHVRRFTTRWLHWQLGMDSEAAAGFEGDGWALAADPAWVQVQRN